MTIEEIQDKLKKDEYRFSDHAIKRIIARSIERIEVEQSVFAGEIIEEYRDDRYSPSCLICGKTQGKRVLHVHISFPPSVVVITTYEPDPAEWINDRIRR